MANESKPFGKTPARSLESFGVAGLLGEKSKVFYSSIFTTKHVGRVTDLLAAKLLDEGLDELKLRALILFGTFEVFRTQGDSTDKAARLAEPLVIECGLDDDKVALGVSFTADDGRFPQLEGLIERITAKTPENEFERLLAEIHAHADRVYLRAQESIRRLEIVALLGITGKIEAEAATEREPLVVITLTAEQKAEPPKVNAYVELGDLDYPELLKEQVATQGVTAPPTGEVLMHGFKEADDAVKIRAENLLEAMTGRRVSGARDGNDLVRIKGSASDPDGSMIKMTTGGAIQAGGEGAFIVKGGAAAAGQGAAEGYQVKSLGVPSQPEEAAAAEADDEEAEDDGDSDERDHLKAVFDKVKKAWPFRLGKGNKTDSAGPVGESGEVEEESEAEDAPVAPVADKLKSLKKGVATPAAPEAEAAESDEAAPSPAPVVALTTAEIQKEAQKLSNEIESGLERTVNRAQAEASDVKKEMGTPRAKRWVDGLMTELVAEKAKLAEASKALNASIKQKEHEFRSKETMLTEELKRRDDMIRQKTNALARAKDQLSQAALSAERLKSAAAGAADDAHYKQKFTFTQKMLNSAKEENSALSEKVEDLKNQLMNAQSGSAKRNQPSMSDFSALQSKYERSIRQADEFKKTNQQLLEKLSEAKKDAIKAPQDDIKKRLEAAVKIAGNHQRDAEKLQIRVEEMQREQMRLKAELNRSIQELKSARMASKAQHAVTGATPTAAGKSAAAKPAAAAKPPAKPGSGGEGTPPVAA
jgi:hypothetical protein